MLTLLLGEVEVDFAMVLICVAGSWLNNLATSVCCRVCCSRSDV